MEVLPVIAQVTCSIRAIAEVRGEAFGELEAWTFRKWGNVLTIDSSSMGPRETCMRQSMETR